ncbi:MAG: respiratory nitrate reductase subunit gamma [Acidimicrobiia bacterium]|nr:respiratory nitrate reductase subunit gamma [Acidimicrobiia bacterium]
MTGAAGWEILLFVALPYVALTVFVVGHVWRYRFDRFGWTARSSELYEKRWLQLGSPLFHLGVILAVAGHVLGILVPESLTEDLGIPESLYAFVAAAGGTTAVVLILAGLGILSVRRITGPRVRNASSTSDRIMYPLMWIMILLGVLETVGYNVFGPGYDYRPTVAVWFRSLFVFDPDVSGIVAAPVVYQVHVTVAWLFLALFPFTRLVHAWSLPYSYLWRPYIVYRRRRTRPDPSPGESAAWTTIARR